MLTIFIVGCSETQEKESRVETLPYYSEATFTPHWLTADDAELADFHQVSPFKFVNQEGDTITEQTYEGKIYITDFFFTTCPGICPKMTDNMAILQEVFMEDDDVFLLSHSVTPGYDSVPVLKEYAENKGVDSKKWSLVTGAREEIYKLGRQDYFVEEDLGLQKEPEEFLHTENFVLVDEHRHIRGIYNGLNKASVNQLIADVKTLKNNR
ncbi:SCO family protein [Portibacter lacus]|uniref:SCO family protein n=2 Tax=Portibacter lacus TaxID=1099794 RepID=A0AA37WDW9_9BACT|nr:SCO family protein [Portibacter lacus]